MRKPKRKLGNSINKNPPKLNKKTQKNTDYLLLYKG